MLDIIIIRVPGAIRGPTSLKKQVCHKAVILKVCSHPSFTSNLLEMQILRPHTDPLIRLSGGGGHGSGLYKHSGDIDA